MVVKLLLKKHKLYYVLQYNNTMKILLEKYYYEQMEHKDKDSQLYFQVE